MTFKYSSYIFSIIILIGILHSCGKNDGVTNSEENEITEEENDLTLELETGVPLPFEPLILNPDSVLPPEIIIAGEPIYTPAHKNIKSVEQPIITLISTSVPHFSIGHGNIKEPVIEEANGSPKNSGYNEPVTSSKFDFNDAASYNIQGIDVDQGLSSSYVLDIIEDRRGNIWFATWTAGVTMYNGRSFIMFDENKGMISNYIWCIFEDAHGNIWFGSDGGGASVYDGHSFTDYNKGTPLEDRVIIDIDGDSEGNVWLATSEGLSKFDGQNFITYGKDQGMSGDYVNSVFVGSNGNLWVAVDEGGINRFDGEGFTHYGVEQGLISNNVTCVYEDSEENIWIGTADSGICMYDGYSFVTYQKKMGLPNNHIRSIIEDQDGNMWFGTDGGGACMFNRFEFKQLSNTEGMSNNFVWSLLEDSDGNIWFGTWGAGANVFNEHSFENYNESQGLNDHIIRYIIQDHKDNLWFSTNNGGVSKYDGKNFWHYTMDHGLPLNSVRCMLLEDDGDFWFGTNGNGVSRFDGKRFYNYDTESGLSGNNILYMYQDAKGNIWFGTANGGVTRYDGKTFAHFTEDQGLANNTVHSIIEDDEGNILFGTKIGGIDRYDGKTITHITRKEGLIDNSVITLHRSYDGTIWVGSEGYGLSHIQKDTIIQYKLPGGHSHNIIWSIIEDDNADLWLGTERGLNNFSIDDSLGVVITNFGRQDGLKGSDFYPNSAFLDEQNRIWWGTGKSLAMLDLNKYQENQNAPTIQITDVRLEQTFLDYRKLKDSLEFGGDYFLNGNEDLNLNNVKFEDVQAFTNCPEQLELPHYLNHITFYFSGIDWSAPHKIQYQYMLQGLDETWRPVTEENWAVYSNTPSGEYIFKVRAIGDAKIWSEVLSYPVIIHAPWWNTWIAYIIYFLTGILAIYLYIMFRTQKLLENKRQLEETVTERTKEVVKQKELVEQKNQEITSSITYAQRIQNAILPSKNLIDEHIKDAFFLYQPKDIVAGDFYWLEVSENHILLAAADCTGHGVPGAMVSVVCNNALNRTVREFKLHEPGEILNKVRELVIETFDSAGTEVKDGMDISLISLNPKTLELKYAGANNDLYIISEGKMIELAADKMPIGRYIVDKQFSEQTYQLKKGDCLYIFTDGYMDQFGGPRGKKFKYAAFKETLMEIHHQDMTKQGAHLVNVMLDWMGPLEQVDDICVIGVRV